MADVRQDDVCHVLIIEDEPLIALDLQMMFETAGAKSFAFADTEQGAIDSAAMQRPDFISSDVTLHEGTGTAAVAAIQRQMGPIPVIFITATPDVCADWEPPRRILHKPLDEHAVCRAFERRSEQFG